MLRRQQNIITIVWPVVAVLLFIASLSSIDLLQMNDLGLASVLPFSIYSAIALLTASFCYILHKRQFIPWILILHIVILVFMLYGVAPFLEGAPRTPISWKLLGIIDRVMDTGTVDPSKDAFQNWPGFFILVAFFLKSMGLQDGLIFSTWAPVFFNLVYLGPMYMLYQVGTGDKRLIWLSIWFFYLANWIGQDYLAPQALGYLFFLLILAILLNWFKQTPHQPDLFYERWLQWPVVAGVITRIKKLFVQTLFLDQRSQPWQRAGLIAAVMLMFSAIVPSHQLTPFAIIAVLMALVVFKRLTLRGLPWVMLVMTMTWISFMTMAYLTGHIETVAEPVGSVTSNIEANVTNRFRGSPDHIFILQLRIVMSFFIWLLAGLGGLRRFSKGQLELTFTLLAIVPFGLLALQAYGGELLMRVYLFSLPFMAFFAASLFYPIRTAGRSWTTSAGIALLSVALIAAFYLTRYGNERMDYFTPQEVEAVQYLNELNEPGSQILAGTQTLPWRFDEYDDHRYRGIERIVRTNDQESLEELMRDPRYPQTYLVLTRSQQASARLFLGWPPGTWERFENTVLDSGKYETIFSNEDARILIINKEAQ